MKDKNNVVERLRKKITLETRLNVNNEIFFINLLTELGYCEDEPWTDGEEDILHKISEFAEKLTKTQLSTIEKWKDGGNPK